MNQGTISISVTDPLGINNGGGGTSSSLPLTILPTNAQPTIGLLVPDMAAAGGPSFTLQIIGAGFGPSSIVTFGSKVVSSAYVNPATLEASIPASAIAVAGTPMVTVANPGGSPSAGSPFTVADYTVTAPTASAIVNAGHPAVFNLAVAPSNGAYSNAVTFTVAGLPAFTTASFTPSATITPGAISQSVTLTITTTPHTTATAPYYPGGEPPVLLLLCLVGMAIAMAWLMLRSAGRRVRGLAPQFLLALLLVAAASLVACAGGGSTSPQLNPATGTPAGTYPIIVTATSGGVSHSTTVTLTVM